ncbi:monovalent cation:proton antiporter-2 (CPA2) family protein [Halomonas huangheensis]|uniref:RCK N-terminal domain-containing protein n=1 Tax=Halomonas huangheensis TaxID=1178482 RepID=W1NBI7_9GAMM|nr:monovalent cation:proton antiporter-2 (CPA2) family protein [Halomonas huangheensis]ALM53783.1 cation:proton antiporter [Halomonas huangheensis]ERL52290.1 hypothetical protein BJB45_10000 [Halomonas huangheensis]
MATTLLNALIFLVAAVVIVPIIKRLGLGEVLGYLVAGVIIGPSVLGLIPDAEAVLHFSEVGIVFLLFIIGLELKPARLKLMRKAVFGFGSLQVSVATLILTLCCIGLFGLSPMAAIVVGFSLALCSTALVLHLLAEQHEVGTRHGRYAFAILLFQDIAAIPVLAAIPMLAGGPMLEDGLMPMLGHASVAIGAFVGLILGGRLLLRPLFRLAASTKSREVFAGTSLAVVIGAAVLMELVGLSMALGAFIAGILLADSEYRHSIEADIEPFRGLLLGLFFMAVGMTTEIGLLVETPGLILGLTAMLLVAKWLSMVIAARLYRNSWKTAFNLAALMPQGGEFAFVMLTAAGTAALLDTDLVQTLVLVISLSMAATPLFFLIHSRLIRPLFKAPAATASFDTPQDDSPRIIIAGFGRFGQIVGRVFHGLKVPYTVLDINPNRVEVIRRYGSKVYFGDASRIDLLEAAGADRAQILVVAVSDPETSMTIIERASKRFPNLKIYVRARNRRHSLKLMRTDVSFIQRELMPASLNITREALIGLGFDRAQAQRAVDIFQRHDEKTLRDQLGVEDYDQLVQTAQQAARELESLYEAAEDIDVRPDKV